MAPRIIGLNGLKGSGKDTAGAYIREKYGYSWASFAAPLKWSAAAALGIERDTLEEYVALWEEWKNDPQARIKLTTPNRSALGPYGMPVEVVDISVREFLQFYGTEAHREVFGQGFWTDMCIAQITAEDALDKNYVITDARFVNECSAIRAVGGTIIEIVRDAVVSGDTHASEEPLPRDLVNTTLYNNGTIEDLYKTIDAYFSLASAYEESDRGWARIESIGTGGPA